MTETPACSHQYWCCRQYNSDVILHYHRLRKWNSLYDCYFLSNSQLQLGCCIILLISSYDWKKVFNPVSRTFSILFPMLHCALSTLRFVILRASTWIFKGPHFQSFQSFQSILHLQLHNLSTKLLYQYFFAFSLMQFFFSHNFYGLMITKGGIVIMVGSHGKWLSLVWGFLSLTLTFLLLVFIGFSLY